MAITPQISLVAYEARDKRVFVKVPNERGRYMLVDRCVIEVECNHCHSAKGEPCKGAFLDNYTVQHHYVRAKKYQAARKRWQIPEPDDQISKPRFKLRLPQTPTR